MNKEEIISFMSNAKTIEKWNSLRAELITKLSLIESENELVKVNITTIGGNSYETTIPKYIMTVAKEIDSSGLINKLF